MWTFWILRLVLLLLLCNSSCHVSFIFSGVPTIYRGINSLPLSNTKRDRCNLPELVQSYKPFFMQYIRTLEVLRSCCDHHLLKLSFSKYQYLPTYLFTYLLTSYSHTMYASSNIWDVYKESKTGTSDQSTRTWWRFASYRLRGKTCEWETCITHVYLRDLAPIGQPLTHWFQLAFSMMHLMSCNQLHYKFP